MKKIIFLVLIIFPLLLKSQIDTSLVSLNKIELGFNGLSLGTEIPLSKKLLINITGGIGGGYQISRNDITYFVSNREASLFIKTELIHYTKKLLKEHINHNFGNYRGVQLKYATRSRSTNNALLFEFHWGWQRAIGSFAYLNMHIGIGRAFNLENGLAAFYPAMGLKIGIPI